MKKIATHDSATGEKPMWYSYPLLPFAKTQSKTIEEQYEAGCRLFDIRLKMIGGAFRLAHGGYIIRRNIGKVFSTLNSYGDCLVTITYEGGFKHQEQFVRFVKVLKYLFPFVKYGTTSIKHPYKWKPWVTEYRTVIPADADFPATHSRQGFVPLDGKSWRSLIPIPWLWKKLCFDKPQFSEDYYLYVDFL